MDFGGEGAAVVDRDAEGEADGGGRSLFAQSVQEKVSPT